MKPYLSIFSMRSRALFQYRAAVAAGASTQIFWGLIRVMIFGAFFASTKATLPLSYSEVVTYIWIGQAIIALLPWGVDSDIRQTISSGQVAYEFVRPIDLHTSWFVRSLAMRGIPTLMRATIIFVIAGLFLNLLPPADIHACLAFGLTILGAWFLSAAITNFMCVTLLWTISGEGVTRLMPAFVNFFSGNIIPLAFFPDWFQPVLKVLPFRGLVDVPIQFYLGRFSFSQLPYELFFQCTWALAFYSAGHALVQLAKKRIEVQGG